MHKTSVKCQDSSDLCTFLCRRPVSSSHVKMSKTSCWGFLSNGRELPHSRSWRQSKESLLCWAEEKCVKALRCHQVSLEAVLYQRIRSVYLTARVFWYNWDSAMFYRESQRGVDNEWVVWMKVLSNNKTAAHQWDFFLFHFFLAQLFFSPRLPLDKTLLPKEKLQTQSRRYFPEDCKQLNMSTSSLMCWTIFMTSL